MTDTTAKTLLSRRRVVVGAAAATATLGALPVMTAHAALGDEGDPLAAIKAVAKGRPIQEGRVTLGLPELAENGNLVSLTVEVASPMTAADHVKTIHIIAEKNPLATLARFHLGARSGRAKVQTNVRLATTQTVTALAEMSDGSVWSGTANVIVTLSACLDGG